MAQIDKDHLKARLSRAGYTWTTEDVVNLIDSLMGRRDALSPEQLSGLSSIEFGITDLYPDDVITPADLVKSRTYRALSESATGDVTFYNLKKRDGTHAPGITVTDVELSASGIYDRIELRYNRNSDAWTKVAVEKRPGSAGELTPPSITAINEQLFK